MHESVAGSAPQSQSRTVDPLKLKSKARLRKEVDPELSGQSQKAIAIDLLISDPQLSRYMGDQYPDDLPAHKVPRLTRSVGPGYMEWLAIQCGGTYHHGEYAPTSAPVPVLIGLLARQSGNTLQQLIQDLSDHEWTPAERQADLPGLRKLRDIVGALLHESEGGVQ